MPTRTTYAGIDQADSATLVTHGISYYCVVVLNRADNRIEAVCYVDQENGEPVQVFRNIVRVPSSGIVDCPKIIASSSSFVVHWLEGTTDPAALALHRATMDMETFSEDTWTQQGSVSLDPGGVYDVQPVIGHGTHYVVARMVSNTQVTIQRFSGYTWLAGSISWTTNYSVRIARRILTVFASVASGLCMIAFERTDSFATLLGCQMTTFDAVTGTVTANVEIDMFSEFEDARYVQASIVRVTSTRFALGVEVEPNAAASLGAPERYMRAVMWREFNPSDFTLGSYFPTWNQNLMSRLWAYAGGSTLTSPTPSVYCVTGYKSVTEPHNWAQAYAYLMNLDFAISSGFDDEELRLRPVATMTGFGIPHSAPSGYSPLSSADLFNAPRRRMNHLPNAAAPPPFGPKVKTRRVAAIVFQRNATQSVEDPNDSDLLTTELVPTNAAAITWYMHLEDPWTVYRDSSDPTQPDLNFSHPYSRAMHQTCKAGSGMFVSGGTPQMYDGENMVECGFPNNPELIGVDVQPAEPGITAGTRQYYCVARWRDGNVVHRAVSNVLTVTTDTDTHSATIRIRCINVSLKDSLAHYIQAQPIEFEVFRTVTDGTVFYPLFGSFSSPFRPEDVPINDPSEISVQFTDTVSDDVISAHGIAPFQYFDDEHGGAAAGFSTLLPVVVPAFTCVAQWDNRVAAISAQDNVFWYSSEMRPEIGGESYQAPEFNPSRTFRIDGIGEVIGMMAMEGRLYLWSRDAIYGVAGIGQSDSATVDAQLQIVPLHTGIGCVDPNSMVLGPDGVYFKSGKGYYLFNRGQLIDYAMAGAPAHESFEVAGNVRSAAIFERRHQIRIVCDDELLRTYLTTVTISQADAGDWIFTIEDQDPITYTAAVDDDEGDIVDGLAGVINTAIDDVNTIATLLQSALNIGGDLVIIWQPNVVPDYDFDAPGAGMSSTLDESTIEVRPMIMIFDTLRKIWTKARLPGLTTNQRANATASGCVWEGSDGEELHVVLQQGGLQVERESTDVNAYADENSIGLLAIPFRVRTSWIHVAGFAGAGRVRSIGVQTSKPNASQYRVDMGFTFDGDYDNPTIEEDLTITVSPPHMRVRPRYQKCVAFYIEVYESAPIINENVRLYGLSAELGIEGGSFRPPRSQIGT